MKDRYEGVNVDYWFLRRAGYSFAGSMEAISLAYREFRGIKEVLAISRRRSM